jgi:hypothetical protein
MKEAANWGGLTALALQKKYGRGARRDGAKSPMLEWFRWLCWLILSNLRLIVQERVQQRLVNFDLPVVIDEA